MCLIWGREAADLNSALRNRHRRFFFYADNNLAKHSPGREHGEWN